jgi:hypothetical protein
MRRSPRSALLTVGLAASTWLSAGPVAAAPRAAGPCDVPCQDAIVCPVFFTVDHRLGTNLHEIWEDCEPLPREVARG